MSKPYYQSILPQLHTFLDPDSESEFRQILAYFEDTPKGVFVDVGANVPKKNSQTYGFEQLGWSGVLVDPLPACAKMLEAERENAVTFNNACTSPEKVGTLTLHISGDCDVMASLEKNIDDLYVSYTDQVDVQAVTLDSLLEEAKVSSVDFLSIDVEGTELDVLKGFDIGKYRPKLILLEDKLYTLDKVCYLRDHGYKLVKRTQANNWFIPEGVAFETPIAERWRLFRKTTSVWAMISRIKRRWDHFRHS